MTINLKALIKIFSLKLNADRNQIKKCLIIAPLYPIFIYYLITVLAIFIGTQFALEALGMFFMLLPFVAGAIIFYFIFIYVFIYIAQLFYSDIFISTFGPSYFVLYYTPNF